MSEPQIPYLPRDPRVAVPHLAWPLRLDGPRLATVEQDTIEDVRQAVHAVAVTPRGARPLAPDVGVDDPTFTLGVVPEDLEADLEVAHELLGAGAVVRVQADPPDAGGNQQVNVYVDLED